MKPSARAHLALGFLLSLFGGAAQASSAPEPMAREISIFSINDFHGHLQPSLPTPALVQALAAGVPPRRAGGLAYLHTLLAQLRGQRPSLLVGAGDMIGATPADSALLDDQPAIESLNRLGLSLSAVGNHELDKGPVELAALLRGDCRPNCVLPGYTGARFDYLAANIKNADGSQPSWAKPFVLREIGGHRVAFVGAVTRNTPSFVRPAFTQGLVFEDEAAAINRVLPAVRLLLPAAIVVVVHEGAVVPAVTPITGPAPAPKPQDCTNLRGPVLDIMAAVDPEVQAFFTAHTHQTYACNLQGRWLVQGGQYGAHVSEIRFAANAHGKLLPTAANLHLSAHDSLQPNAEAAQFVASVQTLTNRIKNEVLGSVTAPLLRAATPGHADSPLGRWVADAQLAYAHNNGGADLALMNASGLRANLAENVALPASITLADLMAVLPFRNELMRLQMTGQQLLDLLAAQTDAKDPSRVRMLQASSNFSYQFDMGKPPPQRVSEVRINNQALEPSRTYAVVMNNFLADGGEGFALLKSITTRSTVSLDMDAAVAHMRRVGVDLKLLQAGRVRFLGQ